MVSFRPSLEILEDRTVLSTFLVTNTLDDGSTGSLRWAINQANADIALVSNINFNIPGSGVQTIAPASALPTITHPVIIDGSTQPGFAGTPLIDLNGASAGAADGLDITASGCTVKDLVINQFQLSGIHIIGSAATGNVIAGNYIGTNAAGTAALGNGQDGVQIDVGSSNNTIGGTKPSARNVISGNGAHGIEFDNNAAGNIVEGNYIGTNATGTGPMGNTLNGVAALGASDNILGGLTSSAANVIAGNATGVFMLGNGVPAGTISWWKADGDATDSVVGNNGTLQGGVTFAPGVTGAAGDQAFSFNGSNSYVQIPDSSSLRLTNTVTIDFWAKRQHLSGHDIIAEKGGDWTENQTDYGVALDNGRFYFYFAGGWRGTPEGLDLNWHHYAVVATNGAANPILYIDGVKKAVTLGGGAATMTLFPSTADLYIGAQANDPQFNYFGSEIVDELAIYNRGLSATEIQSIYNAGGVSLGGEFIQGNYIGLNAAGTAIANGQGVEIDGSSGNIVGVGATGKGNVISGNLGTGVFIRRAVGNLIAGNDIGTNPNATATVANTGDGVLIDDARNTMVGGTKSSLRNIIAGNLGNGVHLTGAAATGNLIEGNSIGTNATGTVSLPNTANGVLIDGGASNNQIGTAKGGGNLIADNGGAGVDVPLGTGDGIHQNAIFANTGGGIVLGAGANNNQAPPTLTSATSSTTSTTVVGTMSGAANTVYLVEIYIADPSGQGKKYLGSVKVKTNASGHAAWSVVLKPAVPVGDFLTATATDPTQDTSTFSGTVQVT